MACRDLLGRKSEQELSPALLQLPGKNDAVYEAALMRRNIVDACATAATECYLDAAWQYLKGRNHADARHVRCSGATAEELVRKPTSQITSMHLSREAWLRLCVFISYTVSGNDGKVWKHGRVVLVLTPPHLEGVPTADTRASLPLAIASCNSCAAPIRRIGLLLETWQWPAIAVVGRNWHAFVECVRQQANAAALRDELDSIICRLS